MKERSPGGQIRDPRLEVDPAWYLGTRLSFIRFGHYLAVGPELKQIQRARLQELAPPL
jgi:hypothetical protein